MDYEELIRIASKSNAELTFMAFSVSASAQMISRLEENKAPKWSSKAQSASRVGPLPAAREWRLERLFSNSPC